MYNFVDGLLETIAMYNFLQSIVLLLLIVRLITLISFQVLSRPRDGMFVFDYDFDFVSDFDRG